MKTEIQIFNPYKMSEHYDPNDNIPNGWKSAAREIISNSPTRISGYAYLIATENAELATSLSDLDVDSMAKMVRDIIKDVKSNISGYVDGGIVWDDDYEYWNEKFPQLCYDAFTDAGYLN